MCLRYLVLISTFMVLLCLVAKAQDDCTDAVDLNVSNNGFGLGSFSSPPIDFTGATLQLPSETFPSGFTNTDKSVWYKFTIATTRNVEVDLKAIGLSTFSSFISATLYQQTSCSPFPGVATRNLNLSLDKTSVKDKSCLSPGTYYIQLGASNAFSDLAQVTINITAPTPVGSYDQLANAYDFGVVSQLEQSIDYYTGCYTIDSTSEQVCSGLTNAGQNVGDYTQSSYHVFTTDNWVDYIGILLETVNGSSFPYPVGYWLYEGDLRNSVGSLLDGCVVMNTPSSNLREYICDLKPNTTYTVKLLFHKDFNKEVKLLVRQLGAGSTLSPVPVKPLMAANSQLGQIPITNPASTSTVNDNFACNALLTDVANQCGVVNPPNSVSGTYDLVTWVDFELTGFANVEISAEQPAPFTCSDVYIRLFNGGITADCNDLQLSDILITGDNDLTFPCMPPGLYSIQLLGTSQIPNNVWDNCASNFGRPVNIQVKAQQPPSLQFGLPSAGNFDGINNMQPLADNGSYSATSDVFGCDSTVRPQGAPAACNTQMTQTIYREFTIGDGNSSGGVPEEGVLKITNLNTEASIFVPSGITYQLFSGDANAQAIANNSFAYSDFIQGLIDYSGCIDYSNYGRVANVDAAKFCLTQGSYTFATYGDTGTIGMADEPMFSFQKVTTQFNSPANAENLGTVPSFFGVQSTIDFFSCEDNAVTIDGVPPCNGATKAIYREFYLADPAVIYMGNTTLSFFGNQQYLNLFKGRASTVGISGLSAVSTPNNEYNCVTSTGLSNNCDSLSAGWYTVVAYGEGPNYTNAPYPDISGGVVGDSNQIYIQLIGDSIARYNRPYKACDAGVLDWGPNRNTADYPENDNYYYLCAETFGCADDLPLSSHPIDSCTSNDNRLVYYVFSITKPSFIVIEGIRSYDITSRVYPFDVRIDSMKMITDPPVQPCLTGEGYIQLCNVQPGYYTLVLMATDNSIKNRVRPGVYVDSVGISRFDHASKAYDFDVLVGDNNWYNGKANLASNPGVATSSDFFFCSTGAQLTDPSDMICGSNLTRYRVNNRVYPFSSDYHLFQDGDFLSQPRRNLWYTFVIDNVGRVDVKVENKTPNKTTQYPYAIYKSDVNGSIPFSQLVTNGGIDSTLGISALTLVGTNETIDSAFYCTYSSEVTFANCSTIDTVRYYILIDNPTDMYPNSQVEVSLRYDSVPVRYDYCTTANVINGLNQVAPPYASVTLGYDTVTGDPAGFICATESVGDHSFGNCNGQAYEHTIWYKVNVGVAGRVKLALEIDGQSGREYIEGDILLLRDLDTTVTDCSNNGLQNMPLTTITDGADTYGGSCISEGTYYIMLTGCSYYLEMVRPVVIIQQDIGDVCTNPVIAQINGTGNSSSSVAIDCHTMGGSFGEDGSNIDCLAGPGGFKSTWFLVDLVGPDKYDLRFCLTGAVLSSPVLYRVLYGDCSSMSVDISSCSSLNNCFTLECLAEGQYYVQVFSPEDAIGDLTLNVSSTINVNPSCNPVKPSFTWLNSCFNDTIYFTNTSSGANLSYTWDFGNGGLISQEVSPAIVFPQTNTVQSYTVTLTAVDTTVAGTDTSVARTVLVYPSISGQLGNDTTLCPGDQIVLSPYNGTDFTWQDFSVAQSYTVNNPGLYTARDTFGCIDSIEVQYAAGPFHQLSDTTVCVNDTVIVDAGNPGAAYSWSTNETTQRISVSSGGNYFVTITNSNGCSVLDSIVISQVPLPPVDAGNDTTICNGQTVTLTANGAIIYSWGNGNNVVSPTTSSTYQVTGTDANGCSATDSVVVNVVDTHLVYMAVDICPGDSIFAGGSWQYQAGQYIDGYLNIGGCDSTIVTSLNVMAIGASTVDTAICIGESLLVGGANQTTTGTYYDTLQGANGCDSIITTILRVDTLPIPTLALSMDTVCSGVNITALATGGDNYAWSNGDSMSSISVSPTVSTSIWVDVSLGACTVREHASIYVNQLPIVNIVGDTIVCFGDTTEVRVNSSSNVSYFWSTNDSTSSLLVSAPGSYTVTITDNNGCQGVDTFDLYNHPEVETYVSAEDPLCYGDSNGSISVDSTFGTPPYFYTWSNGVLSQNNSNIPSGDYGLLVTDANSCTDSIAVTLLDPDSMIINSVIATDISCFDYDDGMIEIAASGGTGLLFYSIDGSTTLQSSGSFLYLGEGSYLVSVMDENQCEIQLVPSVNINNPPPISVDIEPDSAHVKFAQPVELIALPSINAIPPYIYRWEPYHYMDCDECPQTTASPTTTGYISVELLDSMGCVAVDSIFVEVDMDKILYVPNAFSPNGDGVNETFEVYTYGEKQARFQIFDRWGELLYQSYDLGQGWDGYFRGEVMRPGVYVFYVNITYLDGAVESKKGSILLIR